MSKSLGKAPGFEKKPGHRIVIRDAGRRWRVTHAGNTIADSKDALVLEEKGYPPVVYFPPGDVDMDRLEATDTQSHCPFKGDASYYRLADEPDGEDVAWCYPETYDEVSRIAGRIAFYPDRATVIEHD